MKWDTNQLLDAIRRGEDSEVEFKEVYFSGKKVSDPKRNHLAKELSAFANASGGVMVFGVNDKTREILGIPEQQLNVLEQYISDICYDTVKPSMLIDLYRRELPKDEEEVVYVLVAEIERGLSLHGSPDGYFRRSGSSARPMSPDYVLRLQQQRSLTGIKRFEQLPVPQSTMDDLEARYFKRFISKAEQNQETALRKRHLLAKNGDGSLRASVAGILMASEDPREFFPNAYIEAVRYRGTKQDSHFQTDAKEISGPLDQQILDAMAFFRLNQRVAATKELDRQDQPQFSERAVFEAIVNAVAHRDYSVETMKIRFYIFDDRLFISTPGALVNSQTVETLALATATRNELLTNFLRECDLNDTDRDRYRRRSLMERRGDGVGIILDESEKLSGKKPEYHMVEELELQLTIWAAELANQ